MPVTRGFHRRRPEPDRGRIPPGQYDTGSSWPVLTAEATPHQPEESWTLSVDGLVETPHTWSWAGAARPPAARRSTATSTA